MVPATISVVDFGAVGDGVTDNTAALQRAFDYAKANRLGVHVPEGVFSHARPLSADGIAVSGVGEGSVLHASDPSNGAVYLRGSGSTLSAVKITTIDSPRHGTEQSAAVTVDHADRFTIQKVTIEKAGSVGIFMQSASNGRVIDNTVTDTRADSIHMANDGKGGVSHDILVQNNLVERSGDDSISVVTYHTHEAPNHDITITGNSVLQQNNGRGISVVGSHDVTIDRNHVEGGSSNNVGIMVLADQGFDTAGNWNIKVRDNTVRDAGQSGGSGAIFVYNAYGDQRSGIQNRDIEISGNDIHSPRQDGIQIGSGANHGLTVRENRIYGPKGQGVALGDRQASVTATGNIVHETVPIFLEDHAAHRGSGAALPTVCQHHIVVEASGRSEAAGPVLRMTVDGVQIRSDTAIDAKQAEGERQDIVVMPFLHPGSAFVTLQLVNGDGQPAAGYGAEGGAGRSLYIQNVWFDGMLISGTGLTLDGIEAVRLSIPETFRTGGGLGCSCSSGRYGRIDAGGGPDAFETGRAPDCGGHAYPGAFLRIKAPGSCAGDPAPLRHPAVACGGMGGTGTGEEGWRHDGVGRQDGLHGLPAGAEVSHLTLDTGCAASWY